MNNVMIIDGHKAVIQYDLETDVLRGEFVGLNGGADFYADNVADLHREGRQACKPFWRYAGNRVWGPPRHTSARPD